jgi:hypothetical protein
MRAPRSTLRLAALAALAAACGRDAVAIREGTAGADYQGGALRAAVDAYVRAGRGPAAYSELARTVLALRPGMDRSVAEEAELKLVVLALAPAAAVSARPVAEQVEALALTVWPALLAPPIEADTILFKREGRGAEIMPSPGETAGAYLRRLCGGPLAGDCRQIVPEYQGHIVAALAARAALERARHAVSACVTCGGEPGWRDAVRGWESLDRMTNDWVHEIERDASPANWPTAGGASEPDPGLPEAKITATGAVAIGGQSYGGAQRVAALRELRLLHRGQGDLALHVRPELSLAQLRALLGDTRRAGARRVALVARANRYPWERRVYWVAAGAGVDTDLRPTDTVQLLLHALDHVAGPGAVARVD